MIKFFEEYAEYIPQFPSGMTFSGKSACVKIGGKKSLQRFLKQFKGPLSFRKSYSECGKRHAAEIFDDFGRVAVISW